MNLLEDDIEALVRRTVEPEYADAWVGWALVTKAYARKRAQVELAFERAKSFIAYPDHVDQYLTEVDELSELQLRLDVARIQFELARGTLPKRIDDAKSRPESESPEVKG